MEMHALRQVFVNLAFLLSPLSVAAELASTQQCRTGAGFYPDGTFNLSVNPSTSAIAVCRAAILAEPSNADLPAYLGRVLYMNDRHSESAGAIADAAGRGSVIGWVLTGVLYEYGYSRKKDIAEALKWYRRAGDTGHPLGQWKVAERLVESAASPEEKAEAVAWLRKAAAADVAPAHFLLGDLYHRGRLLEQDLRSAHAAYTKAAAAGHPGATLRLGEMHLRGWGVPRDPDKGLAILQSAAEQGEADAQVFLGNLYFAGQDVKKDVALAVDLYTRAAKQGDATAARSLGILYKGGQGIAADPVKTVLWFGKAADAGDVYAQSTLANMYARGDGVKVDMPRAIELYKQAANQGQAFSRHMLATIYKDGRGVAPDSVEAARWMKLAVDSYVASANNGDAQAQYQLGMLAYTDEGVALDDAVGFQWLSKAAKQNLPDAHLTLAWSYQEGRGTKPDRASSARHLVLANKFGAAPDALLGAANAFLRSAAASGDNTSTAEISTLARDVVARLAPAHGLWTEERIDTVVDMAAMSYLNSDYPLAAFCLQAVADSVPNTPTQANQADLVAVMYMLSYVVHLIGDGNAAAGYYNRANALAIALDKTPTLRVGTDAHVLMGSISGVLFAKLLRFDDRGARLLLDYALKKPGDDRMQARHGEILAAANKLVAAAPDDAAKFMVDFIKLLAATEEISDLPSLRNMASTTIAVLEPAPLESSSQRLLRLNSLALKALTPGTLEDLRLLIFSELASHLEEAGQLNQAIYFGKLAVASAESMRSRFSPDEKTLQEKFVTARADSYRLAASLLAKGGRFLESEEVMRRLRFDELRQVLRQSSIGPQTAATMDRFCIDKECSTYVKHASLGEQYAAILKRISDLLATSQPSSAQLDSLHSEQSALELKWKQAVAELAADGAVLEQAEVEAKLKALDAQRQPLSAVLLSLGTGTVAVRYIVRKESVLIFVSIAGGSAPTKTEVAIPETTLNALVGSLLSAISERNPAVSAPAQQLFDVLVRPVAPLIDKASGGAAQTVLMIAPDKALEMVPFAALFDGQRYVAQRWASTVFNDASTMHLNVPPGKPKLHSFGVTRGEPALPYVEDELNKISKLLPSEPPLIDAAFTREKLFSTFRAPRSGEGQSSIVHIASHFTLRDKSLLIGNGVNLSLAEIGKWNMPNTELLTLSACSTAVNPTSVNGEHLQSFATIAQQNGAHAVLATLWPVNDPSSSTFMESFYRLKFSAGATPVSKAKALRQTQEAFLRADVAGWRHPFYWAPYTLLGNWK